MATKQKESVADYVQAPTVMDRRKTLALMLGGAGAVGLGTFKAADYAADQFLGGLNAGERALREIVVNLGEVLGTVVNETKKQRNQLEKSYKSAYETLEQMGVASAKEVTQMENVVEGLKRVEEHYTFARRARIAKDRFDDFLVGIETTYEDEANKVPGVEESFEWFRKKAGKPTGAAGRAHRATAKDRLETLIKLYDTNSDLQRTDNAVAKKINQYIGSVRNMSEEEQRFLGFLKQEYARSGSKEPLRQFIQNYDGWNANAEVLPGLQRTIAKANDIAERLRESQVDEKKARTLLEEGMAMEDPVRAVPTEKWKESPYKGKVEDFSKRAYNLIDTLKADTRHNYDIVTRADLITKDALTQWASPFVGYARNVVAGLAALWAGNAVRGRRKRKADVRTRDGALEDMFGDLQTERSGRAAAEEALATAGKGTDYKAAIADRDRYAAALELKTNELAQANDTIAAYRHKDA